MTNFRNIIVPETLKCLEINDPTVSEILANFQEVLSSCDSSLEDMIQTAQSVAFKKDNVRIACQPLCYTIPYQTHYTIPYHTIS
jgi:hypothetical protein